VVDVVDSVLACGGAERLVATTSMQDLWVTREVKGAAASGVDLIQVCAASSMRAFRRGEVLVVHTSHSGQKEQISRPASEAVPLFWRFVTEKWGIEPWRWDTMPAVQRPVLRLASERARLIETTSPSVHGDPVGGMQSPMHLGIREAQHATGELMRLGLARLVVELHGDIRQQDDEEIVRAFAGLAGWIEPANAPLIHLELSAAAANWYGVRRRTV
jgi:hypothetical protein